MVGKLVVSKIEGGGGWVGHMFNMVGWQKYDYS